MHKTVGYLTSALVFGVLFKSGRALADGRSEPWQMWFQEAASPTMERIVEFHNLLFVMEVGIVVLVLAIMGYIIIKFNAKSNPVPSKTTHNTLLEVIWTAVPVVILITIAVPSLKLLYYADAIQDAEMTLKVTGNQWFWSYTYPDNGDIKFDSVIIPTEELKKGQPRLLSVDNEVVLPVQTNIRLLLTSNDVIHNWAVPSLGLKLDTTPGRTNETWVSINKEGSYYGMCSELCGVNHGFMPIHIRAVSKSDFVAWTKMAKKKFAANENNESRAIQVVNAAAATR
ncbi:MAG: cytochrome c oxidase subunit II [Rhodospirillales bacterium]|nr:cytochrome c oxidase subunit II [Rhodospirillales bacterium]